MKEIRTVGAERYDEILEALETDGACYVPLDPWIRMQAQRSLEQVAAHLSQQPASENEADPKTMFPARLATAPEAPARKVLQVRAKAQRTDRPDGISEALWGRCYILALDAELFADNLLTAAAARYGWDAELSRSLRDIDEWALNAVQYVSVPGREGQVSFPTHRDWGLLTLYPAIGAHGLEVNVGGEFVSVPPNPDGRMLVYAGAVLQKFAKGRIKAAAHHVKQKSEHDRTVLLYYVDPPRGLVLPDGKTVGEYMDAKLRKIRQIE